MTCPTCGSDHHAADAGADEIAAAVVEAAEIDAAASVERAEAMTAAEIDANDTREAVAEIEADAAVAVAEANAAAAVAIAEADAAADVAIAETQAETPEDAGEAPTDELAAAAAEEPQVLDVDSDELPASVPVDVPPQLADDTPVTSPARRREVSRFRARAAGRRR